MGEDPRENWADNLADIEIYGQWEDLSTPHKTRMEVDKWNFTVYNGMGEGRPIAIKHGNY